MSGPGFNSFSFSNLMRTAQVILRTGLDPSDFGIVGGTPMPTTLPGPQTPLTSLQVRTALLTALFNDPESRLTSEETPRFLQESLKLPKEVKDILFMLATGNDEPTKTVVEKTLKELITEQEDGSLKVPVDKAQDLLGANAKDATASLMKLVQGNTMSQTGAARQVAELSTTLGKLGEAVKASPGKAMETVMLLYLPWYPLAAPRELQIDFESGGGGEEEGEADISVILYLQTNTLGRFKISVRELDPLQVVVDVFHEEVAKSILPHLESDLNEFLATEGLPAAVFTAHLIEADSLPAIADIPADVPTPQPGKHAHDPARDAATAGFKLATRMPDRKAMSLQPGSQLSVLVLTTAYAIAKLVFEADEQNSHLQRKRPPRADKLPGKPDEK